MHVTVLFPFTSPDEIASDVLHDAQSALSVVQAFDFSVAKIGRCAATAYLSPDPLEPFVALTTALVKRFPMFRPYGGAHGGIVAHLTVAHADAATAASAAGELEQRLRAHQPIRTCCSSVTLLENSSGPTALVKRFPMFRPYGGAHGGIVGRRLKSVSTLTPMLNPRY